MHRFCRIDYRKLDEDLNRLVASVRGIGALQEETAAMPVNRIYRQTRVLPGSSRIHANRKKTSSEDSRGFADASVYPPYSQPLPYSGSNRAAISSAL